MGTDMLYILGAEGTVAEEQAQQYLLALIYLCLRTNTNC